MIFDPMLWTRLIKKEYSVKITWNKKNSQAGLAFISNHFLNILYWIYLFLFLSSCLDEWRTEALPGVSSYPNIRNGRPSARLLACLLRPLGRRWDGKPLSRLSSFLPFFALFFLLPSLVVHVWIKRWRAKQSKALKDWWKILDKIPLVGILKREDNGREKDVGSHSKAPCRCNPDIHQKCSDQPPELNWGLRILFPLPGFSFLSRPFFCTLYQFNTRYSSNCPLQAATPL